MSGKVSLGVGTIVLVVFFFVPLACFGFQCEPVQIEASGSGPMCVVLSRSASPFIVLAQAHSSRRHVVPVPGPLPATGDSPRMSPPLVGISRTKARTFSGVRAFSLRRFARTLIGTREPAPTRSDARSFTPLGYVPMLPPESSLQVVRPSPDRAQDR